MKSSRLSDNDISDDYISDNYIDKKLKNFFEYASEDITASDEMLKSIKNKVNGGISMKRKFKKAYVIIAAVVLSVTAATGIIAASKADIWVSHSSNLTEKDNFPDKETIKNEFGYDFKYVKEFKNGFKFSKYNFSDGSAMDSTGNVILQEKEAHFDYLKDGGTENEKQLFFSASKRPEDMYEDEGNEKKASYKNVDIQYSENVYKTFPPNVEEGKVSDADKEKAQALMEEVRKTYPEAEDITKVYPYLTKEDIEAYRTQHIMFAYGSQEIETMYTQSASWYENGVAYNIMRLDGNDIEDDEFIDMAKEIIDCE